MVTVKKLQSQVRSLEVGQKLSIRSKQGEYVAIECELHVRFKTVVYYVGREGDRGAVAIQGPMQAAELAMCLAVEK